MKSSTRLLLTGILMIACLACAKREPEQPVVSIAPTQGQSGSAATAGRLEGKIVDESGQPVIGAMIQVSGPGLQGFRGAATDTTGFYIVPFLAPGANYQIRADAPGYNSAVRKGIRIEAFKTTTVPFTLSQGKTEIVVTAAAPMIDVKKTEVGSTFSNNMINPYLPGSSSSNAAFLAPAAAPAGPAEEEAGSADQLLVIEREAAQGQGEGIGESTEARVAEGTLEARTTGGEPLGVFPLNHTEVEAFVSGYLARTVVTQKYGNPFKEVIEAVYVFPLGSMAAVHDFVMEVGGRKIVGIVRPREEAERLYKEARARGQTASLLTQERPNIFTQNVANIEPGGAVTIRITTFERLAYDKGTYEYVFPMVVGPRYIPGAPVAGATPAASAGGSGWSAPTTVVPDADKITPPVLKPGERSGHDIGLTVHLEAGLPLTDVRSVAHKVEVANLGPTRRLVKLAASDAIPNRDFVLRWTVGASTMRFGVLPHREKGAGYFTLMVQPPLKPADAEVSPREITFVLDVSGSMSGLPIETSKSLVRNVLDGLRPEDAFNIIIFSGSNGQLWEEPRPGTPENVLVAKRYLNDLRGGGGTEMLAGVRRALSGRHDPKFLQMYVFCTDGFVGDDDRILSFIGSERGDARFFSFGIGNSVNRSLIEGIGRLGGGRSVVVMPRDQGSADRAASRFFECIDSPVLVDAAVDWNGLPVSDVYPAKLGDLFAGGTLDLVGRYSRPAEGTAFLTGRVGSRDVRIPIVVVLPGEAPDHSELAPVWARHKIADLTDAMVKADGAHRDELVKTITDLAVSYKLASPFTAFVAVDESRIVGDGRPLKVLQPVEMPEGVSYEGVFGESGRGGVMSVSAWGLRLQETRSGKVRVGAAVGGAPGAEVKPGAALVAVNGVAVHDLVHLEGLLLQNPAMTMKVTFDPGGEVTLPAP